jgi:hypothetical protein
MQNEPLSGLCSLAFYLCHTEQFHSVDQFWLHMLDQESVLRPRIWIYVSSFLVLYVLASTWAVAPLFLNI